MGVSGPGNPEGLDPLGRAVAAMEALPGEVKAIREDFTARTETIKRRARWWIGALAAGVATATAAAATALALLYGTVADVRDSQERQDRALKASCTAFARVGDAPLSPTAGPLGRAIVTDFGAAAGIIGCPKPPPLPLPAPTAPGTPPAPAPSR